MIPERQAGECPSQLVSFGVALESVHGYQAHIAAAAAFQLLIQAVAVLLAGLPAVRCTPILPCDAITTSYNSFANVLD